MEFVGSVNSAQCTVHRRTGQPLRLKRKRKKYWENADAALKSAIQTSTKCTIPSFKIPTIIYIFIIIICLERSHPWYYLIAGKSAETTAETT